VSVHQTNRLRSWRRWCSLWGASVCLILSPAAAWPAVAAEASRSAISAAERIARLCDEAKGRFQPPSADFLALLKKELARRLRRLEERLARDGENGRKWRKYLLCDELAAELNAAEPNPETLTRVLARYKASHQGLGLVWFAELREALERYQRAVEATRNAQMPVVYDQVLDAVAARLERAWPRLAPEDAHFLGQAVGWLDDIGQAPELVATVRSELARPNLHVAISAQMVEAAVERPVDRTAPVVDFILGTDIRGTGHTVGRTWAELVPSDRFAVIDVLFHGTTRSRTAGYHGPARIYSEGLTRLAVRKRIWLDGQGVHSYPAVGQARISTTTTGIAVGRGRGLACRIAWRRTLAQKPLAEQIAAQHAARDARRQVDREAEQAVAPLRERIEKQLRGVLVRHGWLPEVLRFRTTSKALLATACAADEHQLAAPSQPPEPRRRGDLTLHVHESLVNNLAESVAGRWLDQDELQAVLGELLGEVPEALRPKPEEGPWAVLFAPSRPVELRFDSDQLEITVRADAYEESGREHPGMDVRAVYRLVEGPEGYEVVRQGKLQIVPPGYVPGSSESLTPMQIAARTVLERRFEKLLKPRLVIEPITLRDQWKRLGRLVAADLHSENGWLSVVLRAEQSGTPDSPAPAHQPVESAADSQ